MKKIRIAEISAAVALIVAVIASVAGFGVRCGDVREDVIRLHILANSDSEEDQNVKLIVRDALLNSGKELFSGSVSKDNAQECLEAQKTELIEIANKVLAENGFDYKARITLAEEYFTTRSYGDLTLPAGEYTALKVILGSGEGHNWWCVMFPPLCLPAASEETDIDAFFGEEGGELIKSSPRYEMRFKIVEVIESIKSRIKG